MISSHVNCLGDPCCDSILDCTRIQINQVVFFCCCCCISIKPFMKSWQACACNYLNLVTYLLPTVFFLLLVYAHMYTVTLTLFVWYFVILEILVCLSLNSIVHSYTNESPDTCMFYFYLYENLSGKLTRSLNLVINTLLPANLFSYHFLFCSFTPVWGIT